MVQVLPDNWLDTAANKGATKWLQKFIRFHLDQLQKGQISPEDFANELEEEFESRRLTAEAQQKNYRSNIVQALKVLDPEHPAIALVALSTEQYRVLNDQQKERVAERETRFIDDPQAVVALAERLLGSNEWSDVGAGLAVLMGRRISEIILSDFDLKSPWSLSFRLMAKKASDQDITIEIPTLVPAANVLDAIRKLQNSLSTPLMKRNEQNLRRAKQRVNSAYSNAIAHQCEQHFAGVVPNRSDKNNLYTHIFRAVYATIAAHWYCPPSVPEHHFKAEIQGHYSLTKEGTKIPNYSARSNYDDYAIGDGNGNRDGRLGIKLGHVEGLQVIEAFRHDDEKGEGEAVTAGDDKPAIKIFDAPGFYPWLNDAVEHATTDWLQHFLRRSLPQLAEDIGTPQAFADNLAAELHIRGVDADQQQPYRQQVAEAIQEGFSHHPALALILDHNHTALAVDETEPNPITEDFKPEVNMKQQTRRPMVYDADLNRLTQLMAQEGHVDANHAELLHALIEHYEHLQAQQRQGEVQTTKEIAQTLSWFTGEVEALRAQVRELQAEREQNQGKQIDNGQLQQLQAENQRLKQELHTTQKRLGKIQSILGGNALPETTEADAIPEQDNQAGSEEPSSKPPTVAKPTARQRQSRSSDTEQQIHGIISAIIQWNHSQEDAHTQLYVSVPVVKALGALVGATYQPVIRDVLQERRDELDNLHAELMLGSRHNVKVDKDNVLKAIAKERLKLDNWNQANYG